MESSAKTHLFNWTPDSVFATQIKICNFGDQFQMRFLFCHDNRFVVDPSGKVYSTGEFSEEIVRRYESAFDEMHIAGRQQNYRPEMHDRLNLLLSDRKRFVALPDLSNIFTLLFGNGSAARELEAAIRATDVVVARLPSEIGMLAAKIARRMGKPLIIEVVACVWDGLAHHGSIVASIYAPIAYWRMRREISRSEWTLYVSREFLQHRYPSYGEKVCVSNVQIPVYEPGILDARLKAMRGDEGTLTLGMIAALFHKSKRVDVAIRALAFASKSAKNLRLEVVGFGDSTDLMALAKQLGVEDRVHFLGAFAHERIAGWLDGIDIYLQTSFQEGLPRALIEAMSRATPALASNAGGTPELIAPSWIHNRGDFKKLAEQILALRSKEVRKTLANENYSRAGDYVAEVLNSRRSAFWQKLLNSHGIASGEV
ncbi:MAG: glycosyltransferase family 4 protein [Rhizomicrobium sp.]